VAGVIKMVLALGRGVVPGSLHALVPSSRVDWSAGAVELAAGAREWPVTGRPRRAGVSSFGVSGTNAHVILEQAPAEPGTGDGPGPGAGAGAAPGPGSGSGGVVLSGCGVVPVVVSARSGGALGELAGLVAGRLAGGAGLADVGWSLVSGRAVLERRAVVVAGSVPEAVAGLGAVAAGEPAEGVVTGAAGGGGGKTVLVFPGQGSQWAGMGAELAGCSPLFAGLLAECGRVLAPYTGWDLLEVIGQGAGAPGLDRVDVVQPVSWAVMVGLAGVWQALGCGPDAVVGHSQGEIAAACVAGVLSLEDAAKVVAVRSQLIAARLAGGGAMVSVAAGADRAAGLAAGLEAVEIAAVNGPGSVVAAGPVAGCLELLARCEAAGVRARRIAVDYASHTGQVEVLRGELAALGAGVTARGPVIPFYSTVTGQWLDGPPGPGYWFENLRRPVRYADAVAALAGAGYRYFIEASAHPVLTAPTEDTATAATSSGSAGGGAGVTVTGTLRRGDGGPARLLHSAASLWTAGHPVTWPAVFAGSGARRVDLPTYPFQRQRYWLISGTSSAEVTQIMPEEAPAEDGIALAERLAGLSEDEQNEVLIDLVIAESMIARGDTTAGDLDRDSPFFDVGFNSLSAVELRNRLNDATGLRLPPMLAFDFPTPALLADELRSLLRTSKVVA
jgi:acyl transferase domain-containing protein